MPYDHGNYDFDHGLLPKFHFSESRYNVKNSGAMKRMERVRDRKGFDRSTFSPHKKMQPYGNGAKSYWAFDRKQHTSTTMRKHYLSQTKTSRRFKLKEELNKLLEESLCEIRRNE